MKRKQFYSLLLVLVFLLACSLNGEVLANVEKVQKEVDELEQIVKSLEEAIKSRQRRISQLDADIKVSEKRLQEAEVKLAEAEAKLGEQNLLFGERVRSAYMKGGLSYLEVFFEAKNFGDVITRLVYLKRILKRDADIMAALRNEYNILQERKAELAAEKAKLADLRYQLEAERKNLQAEKQEQDKLLAAAKDKLKTEIARTVPQAEKLPVYGVVIDNFAAARPQHGLVQADLIYEYEVEGKITRYLALYSQFPTKVGPVRSARQHNMILALENDVRFIHAGGSTDNIKLLKELNVRHTDALTFRGKQFFRDTSRRAPHNLYVNLKELKLEQPSPNVVVRPAYISREGQKKSSFSIDYGNNYTVSYKYVENEGVYHRYINNKQHFDANGKPIKARNIIVQYVPFYNDARGRPTAELVGEGVIDFYSQGKYFKGKWSKSSEKEPTRFYYQDGQEIERVYGQTWIQIVRR
ncbi:MAG: DUF3048 domain-containing protein [Firmicutes bacterium]|nr:DUF3048 domain-containing protein [Bacillota bacterium]